ncbi:putative kinesin [Trypanosoma conorhini]|uniref:Putative kinesin n=1 Tax=Trypanosoma conorhini TaxID=83891 RepID=A0A3R7NVM2_9TRYP|nr:putative kinesin [Trypanosoma conorhini]RNF12513.1 putative kinesin [Trypanosoma conorhini]
MRVYCRFAPPCAPATGAEEQERGDAQASLLPPPMLLLSLRGDAGGGGQTVTLADPRTGSMAASTCRRVFLPACLSLGAGSTPPSTNGAPPRTAKRKNPQEELFDEVVRPVLDDLISGKPCTFLAYGQTATGKTYTMFGPNADGDDSASLRRQNELGTTTGAEAAACRQDEEAEEEEEGIVPRLLRAIFAAPGTGVEPRSAAVAAVDLSCLEVHNECVTDLVALLLQQRSRKAAPLEKKDEGCGALDAEAAWQAWRRYEQRGRPAGERGGLWDPPLAPTALFATAAMEPVPRTLTFKATEKAKVMRAALRLRCESAAECGALLRGVLALRSRSQTERNVRSSRSHLVLRLVLHGAAAGAGPLGESLFVDLAGSETYREPARLAHSPPAASAFSSDRRDGGGLAAAQRSLRRTCEMRHINVSLLALRKVVRALQAASNSPAALSSSVGRVPFRDSALTTILEPFLVPGAASAVTWVVCCSCLQCDFHETVESLRLGAEASATAACVQVCPSFPPARVAAEVGVASSYRSSSAKAAVGTKRLPPGRNASQADTAATGAVIQRGRGKTLSAPAASAWAVGAVGGGRCRSASDAEGRDGKDGGGRGEEAEEELTAYKLYALQLLGQCKTLCERYDECVEELARTKQVVASRDREIARLRKALAANGSQQKLLAGSPLSLSLPISTAPDENLPPAPPAWLRKGAMSAKRNNISSLLCGGCAVQSGPSHVIASEAVAGVVAAAEEEVAAAAAAAEADRLVETILRRCCVHHDAVPVACKPLEAPVEEDGGDVLYSSSSVAITATTSVEAAAPSDGGCGTQTPQRTERGSSSFPKKQNRREHVVSFVSPSSHGAVPLLQLAGNLHQPRRFPAPPSRSALCTSSTRLQGGPPLEVAVTADTQTTAGAHAGGDVRIIQQLLLRGAALVSGGSPKPLLEEGEGEGEE